MPVALPLAQVQPAYDLGSSQPHRHDRIGQLIRRAGTGSVLLNQARGAATHPNIVTAPPVWRAAPAGAVGGAGPAVGGARPGPTHIVNRSRRRSSDVGGGSAGLRRLRTVASRPPGRPTGTPDHTGDTR